MADYKAYNTIISQAISDFDSIFDALRGKSVESAGAQLKQDTTGIATSAYGTLITNQLFRVQGVLASDGVVNTAGVIANYSGETASVTGGTVSFAGSNGVITAAMKDPGYYDAASKFSITIPTETPSLSGVLADAGGTNYELVTPENEGVVPYYRVFATENKILKEVQVTKGSVTGSFTKDSLAISSTTEVSTVLGQDNTGKTGSINGAVKTELDETLKLEDYETITVSSTASTTATATATPNIKLANAGYISSIPEFNPVTDSVDATDVVVGSTIYLPKGKIGSAVATGGDISFSGDDFATVGSAVGEGEAVDAANYYYITANSATTTLKGSTQAGWVQAGNSIDLGTVSAKEKQIKIKKGKVDDISANITLDKVTNNDSLILDSADEDAYEVKIGAANDTVMEGTVDGGFITDGTKFNATASVGEKTLKIAKGHAKTKATLTGIKYSDANSIVVSTLADTTGYYSIVPQVSVSVNLDSDGSKEGYIKNNTTDIDATGLTDENSAAFYVKHGSVEITHGATIVGSSTGLAASGLLETAPASGDYFTIKTSCTKNVVEGYVKTADVTENTGKSYYLPKAKVKYTTDAAGGKFVQVETAGYLPTGVIEAIEGTIDEANVKAILASSTEGILSSTGTTGDYKLSISKSLTAADAGYISSTQGTLELAQDYYVKKGSLAVKPVITGITKGDVALNGTKDKYLLGIVASATNDAAHATFAEGYITADDVQYVGIPDYSGSVELDIATLKVSAGEATLGAQAAAGISTSTSATKYSITPKLTASGAIKAIAATTGWIEAGAESSAAEMSVGTENPIYLTVGSTKSFTGEAKTLSESNWQSDLSSASVSGDYTISLKDVNASFTGTLNEGYYGSSESSISVSQAISGSYTVAHGKVVVKATSGSLGLSATGMTAITTLPEGESAAGYVTISGSITGLTLSNAGSVDGYVKTGNASDWTLTQDAYNGVQSQIVYIKRYEYGEDKGTSATVPTTTVNVDGEDQSCYNPFTSGITEDTIIHTANTYADKNIVVKLSADAVGSNAVLDLEKLQKRLAGTLSRGA